jgi:hypothetical protein
MAVQTPQHASIAPAKRLPLISIGILFFLLAAVLQEGVAMVPGNEENLRAFRETIYFGGALIAIGVFLYGCVDKWLIHPRREAYRIPGYRWLLGILVVTMFGIPMLAMMQINNGRMQLKRDAEKVAVMLRAVRDAGNSQHARYADELNGIGWHAILDFARLKNDKANGLNDSKALVEKAIAISNKYEAESFTMLETAQDRIKALDISDATKEKMLVGQAEAASGGRQMVEKVWALEKMVFQQISKIIALLDHTDAWEVQDNQIVFQSNEDLEKFNALAQALQKVMDEQQQLQEVEAAKTSEAIDSLTPTSGSWPRSPQRPRLARK